MVITTGALQVAGNHGYYWTTSAYHVTLYADYAYFNGNNIYPTDLASRLYGFAVRPAE